MDQTQLDFFKKYCQEHELSGRYAIGAIINNKPAIRIFNGEISFNLAYNGENVEDGVLYRIYPATCGHHDDGTNLCFVGKPNQACIEKGRYSANKCAVYNLREELLEGIVYAFQYEEIAPKETLFDRMINGGQIYIDSVTYNYHVDKQFGPGLSKNPNDQVRTPGTIDSIHKDGSVDMNINIDGRNYLLLNVAGSAIYLLG